MYYKLFIHAFMKHILGHTTGHVVLLTFSANSKYDHLVSRLDLTVGPSSIVFYILPLTNSPNL